MSDAREGAWGVVQSVVSELDFDFDGYADAALRAPGAGRAPTTHDFEEWLECRGRVSCPTARGS